MHARRLTALVAAPFITLAVLAAGCGGGGQAKSAVTVLSTTRAPSGSSNSSTSTASTSTTRSTATTAAGTTIARADIKKTNWLATLRAATGFSVDTTTAGTSVTQPYLNISFAPSLAGYAVLDSVTYGDISGDGFDEAIITVNSGGTAGNTGLLVYQLDASNKLALVGPNDFYTSFGYKSYGQIDNGDLVVGHVVSAGWEPNCCQSGYVERRFRVVGGRMAQQGQAVEAGYLVARSNTIEHFYSLINAKQYDAAYQFTTPAFQAREPFDKWKAGYATTKSVEAEATSTETAGPVKFKLTAVDTSAGGDLKRTFTGVWTLVYSTAKHQWLLDTAEVQLGG